MASEHGVFKPDAKNEGKGKGKTKAKAKKDSDDSDDNDNSDNSDSSTENFGKTLTKKKKPTSKKQAKDALFHVKWFRIVLGVYCMSCL